MLGLSRDPMTSTIYGDVKATMEMALERHHYASVAILLFSGIDILANLDRPEGAAEVTSEDFIQWAERFLVPQLPYTITGAELWSARCAVLHTLGVESRRTRIGEARRISFTVGGGPDIVFNPEIDHTLALLRLEPLVAAFYRAIDRYFIVSYANPAKARLLEERLGVMLMSIPYRPEATAR